MTISDDKGCSVHLLQPTCELETVRRLVYGRIQYLNDILVSKTPVMTGEDAVLHDTIMDELRFLDTIRN